MQLNDSIARINRPRVLYTDYFKRYTEPIFFNSSENRIFKSQNKTQNNIE